MRVRLGINTCFALKRWPRPEDWALLVRDRLGLDLVELSLDLLEGFENPDERRRLVEDTRAALSAHRLEVRSTFTGLAAYALNLLMHPDPGRRAAAAHWYRQVIGLTALLGARSTGGHVGTMSVPEQSVPRLVRERWDGLRAALRGLAAEARTVGLECLMIENLVSVREPSSMAQMDSLLTDGDADHVPVRLCLDVGHQCGPGLEGRERDPYMWLGRYGPTAAEIQLQQSDEFGDHHWPFTPDRNRTGRIDAGRVLDTLAQAGAQDVLLILEIIPGWEDQDDQVARDLEMSVDYWRAALRGRGYGD